MAYNDKLLSLHLSRHSKLSLNTLGEGRKPANILINSFQGFHQPLLLQSSFQTTRRFHSLSLTVLLLALSNNSTYEL